MMGSFHLGPNHEIAKQLLARLDLQTFIETGTWKGGTTTWAAGWFDRVITIEGMPGRFMKSWQKIRADNIIMLLGESKDLLPKVLAFVHEPTMFWLDAHHCSDNRDERAEGLVTCPVMYELLAINAHERAAEHVIMVDDARLFGVEDGWPRPDVLVSELQKHGRQVWLHEDIYYAMPVLSGFALPADSVILSFGENS